MMSTELRPLIPSVSDYKKAFAAIKGDISPKQMLLLRCLYEASDHAKTASQLAAEAGYKNYGGSNLQLGRLGTLLRKTLNYWDEEDFKTYVLCYLIGPLSREEDWLLVMHPEVVTALKELGWFNRKVQKRGL